MLLGGFAATSTAVDGEGGFELSRLPVENDGVLLVRVKGVVPGSQDRGDAQETLILIRVNIQ